MKIAYIIPSLSNSGPTIVINTIVKYLIKWNIKIDVFYFDDIKNINFDCPTYKIQFDTPIDFNNYDIIHSSMYRPDKYVNKWKKQISKAKTFTTIHQDIFRNLQFNYNWLIAFIYTPIWIQYINKMDTIICISNTLRSLYQKDKELITIYNGIDIKYNFKKCHIEIVQQIDNLKHKVNKVIGTYASINKGKGIDQLIKLLELREDIGLVIIGEGIEKNRLCSYVEKRKLNERVLFLPYLENPYNYLEYIDVYAMPSRNEGFGLAMIEAAMTYTPIICSYISVFREIFDDSQAAFFELENIRSLSSAFDKAILESKRLSQNAYKHVIEVFSGEIMAQKYLDLYKSILKNTH